MFSGYQTANMGWHFPRALYQYPVFVQARQNVTDLLPRIQLSWYVLVAEYLPTVPRREWCRDDTA